MIIELNNPGKNMEASSNKENMFEQIAGKSRDAVVVLDSASNIHYWNQSAEKLFGFTSGEVENLEFLGLIVSEPYEDDFRSILSSISSNSDSVMLKSPLELYVKHKNGDLFPVEMKMEILSIEEKDYFCTYSRDISERLNAEGEVTTMVEELQIAKDLIDQNIFEIEKLKDRIKFLESKLDNR